MDQERFEKAIRLIDEANAEDPSTEAVDGARQPRELVYGMRMSAWVDRLAPDASEALQLAARSQHIRRWEIPRGDYPMNRAGYHKWRTALYAFHADTAGAILERLSYDEDTIGRVRSLLSKKNLASDPEMQTLEDAAALVFLENHLRDFAQRDDIDEAKAIDILQKTWRKMTPRGREAALALDLAPEVRALVTTAVS